MRWRFHALIGIISLVASAPTRAQERITVAADVLFYGDNTEFRNPFREGETLFGASPRLSLVAAFNERVALRLGVFANQRFGSDSASEITRPVIALQLTRGRSSFIFGTLNPPRVADPPGPDRAGPHGLLAPLQVETLAFARPYEAGFQWVLARDRLRSDAWLSWQRLNTPAHRERFDAGFNAEADANGWLSLPVQFHIVHEGGQQFASGPVADSYAAAAGGSLRRRRGAWRGRLDVLGLGSRYVPDREAPARSRTGKAVFTRGAIDHGDWRGHLILWRGRDFVKVEGDPNYLSLRRDGSVYGGIRDYAETGITRLFRPASQVRVEVSARLHRVERHYEYSYRVVAVTSARWLVKETP